MIIDRTTKYAKQVLSGNIVAGKLVKLACERHMNDIKRSKTKDFPYKFNVDTAEYYLDFFNFLKHSKGKEWAGKTIELELWQCFIIGSIFGWIHKKTGLRRFRESYNQVARKNGKSTLMSGIGLAGLIIDDEPGAEVYAAATKKDQAKIVFDEAKKMAEASEYIRKYIDIYKNDMSSAETYSKFEPLSSDTRTLDGLNTHIGIVDEYHAHPTSEVYDLIEGSMGSRSEPLIFIITTAGFDMFSACYEKYEYCVQILEGIIDNDTFFIYVAQLDEGDDPFDESVWPKANPNLGVSKKLDYMRNKARTAQDLLSARDEFFCKQLNIWLRAQAKWMDMNKWKACNKPLPDLTGRSCYAGVDLASIYDLASVTLDFPLDDGYFALISHSFMPEDMVAIKEKLDKVPYQRWIDEGWITATPGNTIDYDWIQDYINKMKLKYDILEIDYDPWNARQFINDMANDGFEVVEITQNIKNLSEPTKNIEKLTLDKKLIHGNNPVLTWSVSNAVPYRDNNENIRLDKKRSRQRIDPIASAVTAHARAMFGYNNKSMYEERGVRSDDEE